ncbi:hypothetical protein TRVL_08375 [Trypanosoma vivax]|nr:hypothetical protein TRVL_08375 [Trypanosoma vivax]
MPKKDTFMRTFDAAHGFFQNETEELIDSRSALFQQKERATSENNEQQQGARKQFAAVHGENGGLNTTIYRLGERNRYMLGRIKSLQERNVVLVAECEPLKTRVVPMGRDRRGADAHTARTKSQLPQQCKDTVFNAPPSGEQQRAQAEPMATKIGFRGTQGMRNKLSETSFDREEKTRTDKVSLVYLMAVSLDN